MDSKITLYLTKTNISFIVFISINIYIFKDFKFFINSAILSGKHNEMLLVMVDTDIFF